MVGKSKLTTRAKNLGLEDIDNIDETLFKVDKSMARYYLRLTPTDNVSIEMLQENLQFEHMLDAISKTTAMLKEKRESAALPKQSNVGSTNQFPLSMLPKR